MSDVQPHPAPMQSSLRLLNLAGRFVLGYVVAIAAGTFLFSLVECLFPDGSLVDPAADVSQLARQMWQLCVVGFVFGGVFALPYTIVGALVFRFLLPRNWIVFMIVGILCPTIALMTLNILLGGGASITDGLARMAWTSLPAGIIATYLFGAIGFGLGFGKWRFA